MPNRFTTNYIYPTTRSNYFQVLATDYTGYALIYSCEQVTSSSKNEYAWIVSREKTLDASIVSQIKMELSKNGVDIKKFIKTNQDDSRCSQ